MVSYKAAWEGIPPDKLILSVFSEWQCRDFVAISFSGESSDGIYSDRTEGGRVGRRGDLPSGLIGVGLGCGC